MHVCVSNYPLMVGLVMLLTMMGLVNKLFLVLDCLRF